MITSDDIIAGCKQLMEDMPLPRNQFVGHYKHPNFDLGRGHGFEFNEITTIRTTKEISDAHMALVKHIVELSDDSAKELLVSLAVRGGDQKKGNA